MKLARRLRARGIPFLGLAALGVDGADGGHTDGGDCGEEVPGGSGIDRSGSGGDGRASGVAGMRGVAVSAVPVPGERGGIAVIMTGVGGKRGRGVPVSCMRVVRGRFV